MHEPQHRRPYGSVLDTIGWTPLIRLSRIGRGIRTPIYGKAEHRNPGGSVKDRIGIAIINDADARGELRPGGTVVEATSGNTGVGLAMAAGLKGYRCIFTMPDKMSQEKIRLLQGVWCRGRRDADRGAAGPSRALPGRPSGSWPKRPARLLANQYYNPVNPEAHYRTTGPEIWEQTEGRDHPLAVVAGTGGTISGVAKYLKERNPRGAGDRRRSEGSVYTYYARDGHEAGGAPYKVEGIGGDKIPANIWFDMHRRVPHGRGSHGHAGWPAASPVKRGSSSAARPA